MNIAGRYYCYYTHFSLAENNLFCSLTISRSQSPDQGFDISALSEPSALNTLLCVSLTQKSLEIAMVSRLFYFPVQMRHFILYLLPMIPSPRSMQKIASANQPHRILS